MRKKIMFGMFAFLALTAVAGERYFNRVNGQDIPLPKAPESEKKDLFDLLKKDLEAKKEAPTFPALPSTKKEEPAALPTLPAIKTQAPTLPALPEAKKDGGRVSPLPTEAPPSESVPEVRAPKPAIPAFTEPKAETQKSDAVVPKLEDKPAATPTFSPPQSKPEATPTPTSPSFQYKPAPETSSQKKADIPSFPEIKPTASQPTPLTTTPKAVALPKNSPWALSVVLVDGQTIVTATVNKKHEFKILCQTLDLQTGKGTLKASGKVQINGDALNGTCEHLSITLMEDRLLLEGKALVTIDRTSSNVSDTTPASFELKGETLNLRISELQTTAMPEQRPVDAVRVSRNDTPSKVVAASMKLDGTQWSPYGRLRAVKSNGAMWSLESSDGNVIAYLLAREGGSLERYVGQSISVYGTRERELSGQPVLRVTHIALP